MSWKMSFMKCWKVEGIVSESHWHDKELEKIHNRS